MIFRSLLNSDQSEFCWSVISSTKFGSISVCFIRNLENNREIFWNPNTSNSPSATQCATWVSGKDIGQNGLAFRIDKRADGSTNAIVLERNIWAYAYWKFVPIMFHNGHEYVEDFEGIDGIDLSPYLGTAREAIWPLRICASLGADDVLSFAVAKESDVMPPLSNPGLQGGSWKLDISRYFHTSQGETGKNGGIYAAHIPQGTTLVFEDVALSGSLVNLSN